MEIDEFAQEAMAECFPHAPEAVMSYLRDDYQAGEYLTSFIELIEAAPEVVPMQLIVSFEEALQRQPDGVHKQAGLRAVKKYRTATAA